MFDRLRWQLLLAYLGVFTTIFGVFGYSLRQSLSEELIILAKVAATHAELQNGRLIIGTFSTTGPEKCSGLPIKQYNEESISGLLKKWFEKIKCINVDHTTPFHTIQNFLFCSFKKINFQ